MCLMSRRLNFSPANSTPSPTSRVTSYVASALCARAISLPVAGEHDLLGQYLLSGSPDEDHDFTRPGGGEWQEGEKLQILDGTYAGLEAHPGYKARKDADKVSYAWDNLLRLFTSSIIADERAIGIGTDASSKVTGCKCSSNGDRARQACH